MPGSLINRGNNKWELRVSHGYDANKKQRRFTKTIYASTKKEAKRQLAEFYLEVVEMPKIDNDITFKEFVGYWDIRHSKKVTAVTMANYRRMLKNRLIPAFGFMKLNKINEGDILRFMDSLSSADIRLDNRGKSELSSVTIKRHFKLLNLLFKKAYDWHYLRKNPCELVPQDSIVKEKSNRYPIWDKETLKRFMALLEKMPDTLANQKNKLMFYIAIMTGARRGEFLGLTWDCVDLENKELKIIKAMKYICGREPFLEKPKTESSNRVLYFDDYLRALFMDYKAKQDAWLVKNNIRNTANLVFVSRRSLEEKEALPVNGDCFYLWLKRMCCTHNFPRIAVHSLRAMAATYALISGMPLNMVQAMLGHVNISTTSIYLRDVQDERKEVTSLLSNHLENLRKN